MLEHQVKAPEGGRMDNQTEGITTIFKGFSSPVITPNQDQASSVLMQAPVTPLKPTARKRKLVFDDQLPNTQTQWFSTRPLVTSPGVVKHNVCWLSPPQTAVSSQQTQILGSSLEEPHEKSNHVVNISPRIHSQHANLYSASGHIIANESIAACERTLTQTNNNLRTWGSGQIVGFGSPEDFYAAYSNANQLFNGGHNVVGLTYGNDNLEFNTSHGGHYLPDSVYMTSNAVYGNAWNTTYPYLSFPASANGFPVQYFQSRDNTNKSEAQTLPSLPSIDNSLAPVTPEKNNQNERLWERQSTSTADLYLEERILQEKQQDPLHLRLSSTAVEGTFVEGAEVCGDHILPPLVDSSSVGFESTAKSNQLVAEGENDDNLDLNRTPQKPNRRKHRPKVIREGQSVKKTKNTEQPKAKIFTKRKNAVGKQCLSEDATLDTEASLKTLVEKATLADTLVNVTEPLCQEPRNFSEEPTEPQSQERNLEREATQQAEFQIQLDADDPPTLKPAPQEEVVINYDNKTSNTTENLSQSLSIVSPVKRKTFRENVKTLARRKEKPVTTDVCKDNSEKNRDPPLQRISGGFQTENSNKGKIKKRQARKLANGPSNNLGTASPAVEHELRVGDQNNKTTEGCQSAKGFDGHCSDLTYSGCNTRAQEGHPSSQREPCIRIQDSIHDSQSSNSLHEPAILSVPSQAGLSFLDPVDEIIQRMKQLKLYEKDVCTVYKGLGIVPSERNGEVVPYVGSHDMVSSERNGELVPYVGSRDMVSSERNGELVPYAANRDMVAYEGPFDPLKKRKSRPRVELDNETNRVWRLLMGKASTDDKQAADDEEREWQWEDERRIFKGRVDSFIARMHLVQGDRRFSQWKGSVVDSVVGAFLTQNVSDHLSSSAFISLASRFPPVEETGAATCDKDELEEFDQKHNQLGEHVSEMGQIGAEVLIEQISGHCPINLETEEQGEENPKGMANSGESYASNVLGEKEWFSLNSNSAEGRIREHIHCETKYDHRLRISDKMDKRDGYSGILQDQSFPSVYHPLEKVNAAINPTNESSDRCGSSSENNSEDGEQTNESRWKTTNPFAEPHSFTELLRKVESRKYWSLEANGKSYKTCAYAAAVRASVQFPSADGENREAEINGFSMGNHTHSESYSIDGIDYHNCVNIVGSNSHSQSQEFRWPNNDMTPPFLARHQLQSGSYAVEAQGVESIENKIENSTTSKKMDSEDINCSCNAQPGLNMGVTIESIKSVQEECSILPTSSEVDTINETFGNCHDLLTVRTGPPFEAEINDTYIKHYYGEQPERIPIPSSELMNHSDTGLEAIEDHMIDFFGRNFQEEQHPCKVSSTQDSSLTEDGIHAAATLWSLAHQGNSIAHPENLNPPGGQLMDASELAQSSTIVECHMPENLELGKPKGHLKNGKSGSRKVSASRVSGVARANIEMTQGSGKQMFDWESIRKKASKSCYHCAAGKRERDPNTKDAMHWDAVRCAEVEAIADTIRERGMNNILAGRIKAFLERLQTEHGSIDLEWLKDIPPADAKDFLLSIRGLGLKSVECIRLLSLQHLAFPVDTNVGRICVRLGWVPLQPLPESLQLHLLELYPVLESIQKYLWPRLCTLDQRTLYELHYQMITFGKGFLYKKQTKLQCMSNARRLQTFCKCFCKCKACSAGSNR
eukprot:Gb_09301 [translate_table: standard]